MKKALVTGGTGFAGSHLLEYLAKKDKYELHATFLTDDSVKNVDSLKEKVNLVKVDLGLEEEVFKLTEKIKPDIIFHLAAFTSPAQSFNSPKEVIVNNVSAQINLLESIKKFNLLETRVLITSSADIYGLVKKENLPINENTPLNPTNPYSVSKITQDFLALQYFLSYKIKTIRVRPFNHVGPKQSPNFVVSAFAKKIAEIEKGKREPVLTVGNLEAKRDFTDVGDMVRAYDLIIEKGIPGDVYNIGSGVSRQIKEVLEMLLSLSKQKIKVETDKSLLRPVDDPELRCDSSKIEKITGWKPQISFEKTLEDTLDYWRNIL